MFSFRDLAWASCLSCTAVPALADVRICNDTTGMVHAVLANQTDAGFTSSGWWTVAPNACSDTNFVLTSENLFYAADADPYRQGNKLITNRWGNKIKLYVSKSPKPFTFESAEKARPGSHAEQFSSSAIPSASQGQKQTITLRITPTGTATQTVTGN